METCFINESGKKEVLTAAAQQLRLWILFLVQFFSVIVSIFLLHMMYRQLHCKNFAYTYIHTFFILYIEFGRSDLNCFENQFNSYNSILIYLNASFTAQWPITKLPQNNDTQKNQNQSKLDLLLKLKNTG